MNREMQIILEIDNQAEIFYPDAEKLGDHAATAIKKDHRAQLTSLETIAESTNKISDVFDYIKKQTARNASWREPHRDSPNEGFGIRLKKYLETDLKERSNRICQEPLRIGDTSDEGKRERRRIHLLLIRQFIRQMVVQYEYKVNVAETENKIANQARNAQRTPERRGGR